MLPGFPMPLHGQSGPIEFVGSYQVDSPGSRTSSYTLSFAGNLTGGLSTSPQAGDLVLAYWGMSEAGGTNFTVPSGWVLAANLFSNRQYDTDMGLIYKIMPTTPDSSVDFVFSRSVFSLLGCHVFRGVDAASPLDGAVSTDTGNTAKPNPPSVTKSDPSFLVFAMGAAAGGGNVSPLTSSDLSNFASVGSGLSSLGAGVVETDNLTVNPAQFGGGGTFFGASWAALTMSLRRA